MSWKPKFFIVYPDELIDQIEWPEGWGYRCVATLPSMLKEVLKVETIGSEIKLIWNDRHRNIMLEKNSISNEQLDDYLRANCSMLSFKAKGTMKRAVKALEKMGATNFVCVNSYRDMVLQQAFYRKNKKFDLA